MYSGAAYNALCIEYTYKYMLGTVVSVLWELLNEDVVSRLIRHAVAPRSLLGLETTF